jgi:hypothetical protein
MSDTSVASAGTKASGTGTIGAVLVLIGGVLAGVGVFLTWLKVTGASAKVDFAGGTVQGTQVPPIHVTRTIPLPGGAQLTSTGWDHKSGKLLLAFAVILLVIGVVMLVQRTGGRGLAGAALAVAVLAVILCIYVYTQKDSQAQQTVRDAFKKATGQNLSDAINKAIAQQGISGLTVELGVSAAVQIGLILCALGSLAALIGGVLGLTSAGAQAEVGAAAYSGGVQVSPTGGWGAPPPAEATPPADAASPTATLPEAARPTAPDVPTPPPSEPAPAPAVEAPPAVPTPTPPPAPPAEPEGGGDQTSS